MRGLRLLFGLVVLFSLVAMRPASAASRTVSVRYVTPATPTQCRSPGACEFSPSTRDAATGDTLVWNNNTADPHTATASDGSFDVTIPANGSSAPVAITGPTREISYHCNYHSYMTGTISFTGALVTTTTAAPTTTTTRRTTTSRATTTSRGSSTTSSTFTTETLALDTTTSEGTTTTAGQVALKSSGGGTNAGAVAVLIVAIGAILGGGGYLLYRLRSGHF